MRLTFIAISRAARFAAIVWVVPLLAAGCGGEDVTAGPAASRCKGQSTFDSYTPGLKKSDAGVTVAITSADPAPPDRGKNTWTLAVTHNGQALSGASVSIKPWMPAHGHGTTPPTFTATAGKRPGAYAVGPFDLFMPGGWRVTVRVDQAGKRLATVAFLFCIEG